MLNGGFLQILTTGIHDIMLEDIKFVKTLD